jgi:hypothetical protein
MSNRGPITVIKTASFFIGDAGASAVGATESCTIKSQMILCRELLPIANPPPPSKLVSAE